MSQNKNGEKVETRSPYQSQPNFTQPMNFPALTLIAVISFSVVACGPKNSSKAGTSAASMTRFNIEGISLELPSRPIGPTVLPVSPQVAHIIKRQAGYEARSATCRVVVFHLEQDPRYPVGPNLAIEGALEKMRSVPGTTDFISQAGTVRTVGGIKIFETVVSLRQYGVPREIRLLVAAKSNHLYQISVEGSSGVGECAAQVFGSVGFE